MAAPTANSAWRSARDFIAGVALPTGPAPSQPARKPTRSRQKRTRRRDSAPAIIKNTISHRPLPAVPPPTEQPLLVECPLVELTVSVLRVVEPQYDQLPP